MSELDKAIDNLAKQVNDPSSNESYIPEAYMRFATVTAVASTTATIQFAASAKPIAGVHWIAGVTAPVATNTVAVIQYKVPNEETCYLILGKLS